MQGLSQEIESGIETVLEGLALEIRLDTLVKDPKEEFPHLQGYTVEVTKIDGHKFSGLVKTTNPTYCVITNGVDSEKLFYRDVKSARAYDPEEDIFSDEKMASVVKSKTESFVMTKDMLKTWIESPNAPSKDKVRHYVERLVAAGEKGMVFLRKALAHKINYDELEPHRINTALKAKPIILRGIFDIDNAIKELNVQLELDEFDLKDKEFKIGYPEKFAKGEFYPEENYWKEWYNEKEDAIKICPFSTEGEIIELEELKVQLPAVPKDETTILFYDLPKEEQYWRRPIHPDNITVKNVDHFHDYIMEEYRRRREGIWFMNNGEPVYLTGHHYYTLTNLRMLDDGKYMSFLMAQAEMFYHAEACIRDPRSLGQVFFKSRRTGFTYAMLGIKLNRSTSEGNAKFGMTSKSSTDVEEVWAKYSYAFLNLPFWLRPVVKGKEDSTVSLEFSKPPNNTKVAKKERDTKTTDYLNTTVDYRPTKNDSYDSVKLDMYLGDEFAKWVKPGDYIVHLGMVTPTMMVPGRVVGKCFIGSTMGAREKGGDQAVEIALGSKPSERDPKTGRTATGLYRYFLRAQHNLFEFTDKYGKCWSEPPPEGEVIYNMFGERITMGAEEYLIAVEEQKRKQSDKALNEQLRTFPRNWSHVMRDDAESSVYNLHKLYEQIDYNHTLSEDSLYMTGNFEWEGGQKDTKVVFHQNRRGRFKVSWLPSVADSTDRLQNNVMWKGGLCFPLNGNSVRFGCDPYSMSSTHGEGSKGAIHGKTMMLPEEIDVPSNKWVVEYIHRPPKDTIFFEDVIKVIHFYGALILVESNRPDLLRYMVNRGYRAFIMDRVDRPKNKLNDQEINLGGQMMSGKDIIDAHQNIVGAWIEDYVGVYTDEVRNVRPIGEMGEMPFFDTLNDWARFNPAKRTKHDATISSGLALMACVPERFKTNRKKERPKISVDTFTKKYKRQGQMTSLIRNK